MREAILDSQSGLYLAEPLDTWLTAAQQDFAIPEAGGSSARVFLLKNALGKTGFGPDPAFKVMRHDRLPTRSRFSSKSTTFSLDCTD